MQTHEVLSDRDNLSRGIDETRARLLDEFQDRLRPDVIEKLVDDTFQNMKDSNVREFVPLFVYRGAREQLADIARSGDA